jgi:hypothetical protein
MEYTLWGNAQLRGSYMIRIHITSGDRIWDTSMEWDVEPTQEQIDLEVQKVLAKCQYELDNPMEE